MCARGEYSSCRSRKSARSVDHGLRLLRGGGIVEPGQRLAVHALLEDRKILPNRVHVEGARPAAWRVAAAAIRSRNDFPKTSSPVSRSRWGCRRRATKALVRAPITPLPRPPKGAATETPGRLKGWWQRPSRPPLPCWPERARSASSAALGAQGAAESSAKPECCSCARRLAPLQPEAPRRWFAGGRRRTIKPRRPVIKARRHPRDHVRRSFVHVYWLPQQPTRALIT